MGRNQEGAKDDDRLYWDIGDRDGEMIRFKK